ncbi:MAG: NAD-dependent epimerase/dehydratase family protein [Actinobacteria bacterium]|nr:NAD-dependent epimerase/dehydratase family protein [Actinomycetota bacterium]MCI0544979.1 NAD-dependent epimerase/dehydratase family protein [Actinomycetota bacterium]
MRVGVTGGSGVVGAAVVRHLVEAGHEVVALARSDRSAARLATSGARPVIGDLSDDEALTRLVKGAELVFHVAGMNVLCPVDPAELWRVNVGGTRRVIAISRRHGVTRLVHTSSAVTLGELEGETATEDTARQRPPLSHYEETKTEAERVALADNGDLEVVCVNPASVQGPGRSTGTGRILLAASRGRLPVAADTVFSLVDVDDCARGHLLAAEKGAPGGRYVLSGATLSTREALDVMGRIMGRRLAPFYLPPGLLRPLGHLVVALYGVVGRPPPLCPESVRVLLHGHRYDGSKATRELGLVYTPLESTFLRVVDWFRTEGLLA